MIHHPFFAEGKGTTCHTSGPERRSRNRTPVADVLTAPGLPSADGATNGRREPITPAGSGPEISTKAGVTIAAIKDSDSEWRWPGDRSTAQ